MTKTKRILTIAIAVILIAAAIFFAVWSSVGSRFDYSRYANNVKIDEVDYLGLVLTVDLSKPSKEGMYDEPTDDDVTAAIAEALYKFRTKKEGSTTAYEEYKDVAIGRFDAIYCNYLGRYEDGKIFTSGEAMAKSTLQTFLVGAGSYGKGEGKWFADQMIGLLPNASKYTVAAPAEGQSDIIVVEGAVVYIDYSWIKYEVTGEGDSKVRTEAGKSGDDKNLVDEDLRVDLANPQDFPGISGAAFAEKIVGGKVGTANKITFTTTAASETVEGAEGTEPTTKTYEYDYTVIVNFAIDEWTPFEIDYTYPADSEAKDIYGNSLAGKAVTFEVVVEYFHDVPDLGAKFENKDKKMESVVTHDDYLNLDADTSYYHNHEEGAVADDEDHRELDKLLSETEWNALTTKEHETYDAYVQAYDAYLAEEYRAYVLHNLTETYQDNRMYAAADMIWSKIVEKAEITYPERAVKLAYEERLDYYEYLYNEGTSKQNGKEVANRTLYKNVGAYIEAAYKSEIKEKGVSGWQAFVKAEAKESVAHTLIVYHLYDKLDLQYDDETYSDIEYMAMMYQLYGAGSFTQEQVEEAAMFDCILRYLYENADITWKTVADADEGTNE